MWHQTRIVELLKIKFPLIQAPMAGVTTPQLVAAVSEAGGLGSLSGGYLSPDVIRKNIHEVRRLTKKPFAVNLFVPNKYRVTEQQVERANKAILACCEELHVSLEASDPPYEQPFDEQVQVLLEEEIPAFSFTFGIPGAACLEAMKKLGIIIMGTATTLSEARLLEQNGVDIVVAQGREAGGHRGTFLSRAEDGLVEIATLTPMLVAKLQLPVVASGGIMNAAAIAAALAQGAAGVQMGTAFLCCPETAIHPGYKGALLNCDRDITTLTRAFSGKMARGIKNKFIEAMLHHENDIVEYPVQNALTTPMRKAALQQNRIEFMSLWAGQGLNLCAEKPAAELIKQLVADLNKMS